MAAAGGRGGRVPDDRRQVARGADRAAGPRAARARDGDRAVVDRAPHEPGRALGRAAVVVRAQDDLAVPVDAPGRVELADPERQALGVRAAAARRAAGEVGGLHDGARLRAALRGVADVQRHRRRVLAARDRGVGEPRPVGGQVDVRGPRVADAPAQGGADLAGRAGAAQADGDPADGLLRRALVEAGRLDDHGVAPGRRRGDGEAQQVAVARAGGQTGAPEDVAALGRDGLPAARHDAGHHRREGDDGDGDAGLEAHGAAGTGRQRAAGVGPAHAPPGQRAEADGQGRQDDLRDEQAAVVAPAQEVPAVDLAQRGDRAGDGEDRGGDQRGGGVGLERADAVAAEDDDRDQTAEPDAGRGAVQAADDGGEDLRAGAALHVAVDAVADHARQAGRQQQQVGAGQCSGAAPPGGESQGGQADQRHEDEAAERDAPVGVVGDERERRVADAGGGQHGDGLGRTEQREREGEHRQPAPATIRRLARGGRRHVAAAALQAAQQRAADERRGAEQPEPADDGREPAVGRGVLVAAAARRGGAGAGQALGARGRRAVLAVHAEAERPGGGVAVRAEGDPAHLVDGRGELGEGQPQPGAARQARGGPDDAALGGGPDATHLDRRPAWDHVLGQRQADLAGRRRRRQAAERRRLHERGVGPGERREHEGEERRDDDGRGGDPPRPGRAAPREGRLHLVLQAVCRVRGGP